MCVCGIHLMLSIDRTDVWIMQTPSQTNKHDSNGKKTTQFITFDGTFNLYFHRSTKHLVSLFYYLNSINLFGS